MINYKYEFSADAEMQAHGQSPGLSIALGRSERRVAITNFWCSRRKQT